MSGFTGDWDGRRPSVHQPPDPPYTLDQLEAAARILQDELGLGWRVRAVPRLVVEKWPSRDVIIVEATPEAARLRVAEHEGG